MYAMDLEKMASRVAGVAPVRVKNAIFDGRGYSMDDLVGGVDDLPDGPLWVAMTGFGWLAVDADPATLSPETPVEGGPVWESGTEDTWGKVLEGATSEEVGPLEFSQFASKADFLKNEDTVRYICSYDEDEQADLVDFLRERGDDEAADFAENVEM